MKNLVLTKTSSAGKNGAVKTQRNYPVRLMVVMTNAGRESLGKILLVQTMTKNAGSTLKTSSMTENVTNLVLTKTSNAGKNGAWKTLRNYPARLMVAMTNAGRKNSRITLLVKRKMKTAGNALQKPLMTKKVVTVNNLVLTKTSNAGRNGAVKTLRNYPARLMVAMTNAGRKNSRKTLLVKRKIMAAGNALKKPLETRMTKRAPEVMEVMTKNLDSSAR